MIRPVLTHEQAEATAVGLGLLLAIMRLENTYIAGARHVDLAAAREQLKTELQKEAAPSGDFEAIGIREFERGSWDPRTAKRQMIEGGV